ncbi:MAG: hypothetical protein JNL74_17715 [Fibrobacteres bacterium]|nr:hypothetical protein [Fibrobacterota bacterium]
MSRIGILLTQPANPERDSIFGNFADMFKTFLLSADSSLDFRVYNLLAGDWPVNFDECDGWLITGSFHGAYDDIPWIHKLKDLIVELHKAQEKIVGICFGHQIIAEALGGKVIKSEKGWGVGVHSFTVAEKFSWMNPPLQQVSLLYSHQDQVVALPPNAVLIGGDDFCPNRMFAVDNNILVMQGHPEFSVEFEHYLLKGRREILTPELYSVAESSLKKPIDNETIAKWVVNFILQ